MFFYFSSQITKQENTGSSRICIQSAFIMPFYSQKMFDHFKQTGHYVIILGNLNLSAAVGDTVSILRILLIQWAIKLFPMFSDSKFRKLVIRLNFIIFRATSDLDMRMAAGMTEIGPNSVNYECTHQNLLTLFLNKRSHELRLQ